MSGKSTDDTEHIQVKKSDLAYWVAAVANTVECDDCGVCDGGQHSVENVEKEMRRYIETDTDH